jgi:hypothetical protein
MLGLSVYPDLCLQSCHVTWRMKLNSPLINTKCFVLKTINTTSCSDTCWCLWCSHQNKLHSPPSSVKIYEQRVWRVVSLLILIGDVQFIANIPKSADMRKFSLGVEHFKQINRHWQQSNGHIEEHIDKTKRRRRNGRVKI